MFSQAPFGANLEVNIDEIDSLIRLSLCKLYDIGYYSTFRLILQETFSLAMVKYQSCCLHVEFCN